jgi:hypothetical protein
VDHDNVKKHIIAREKTGGKPEKVGNKRRVRTQEQRGVEIE